MFIMFNNITSILRKGLESTFNIHKNIIIYTACNNLKAYKL